MSGTKKMRGFTLAELLVVVAIIAVLVAISIPIFTAQMDKARKATDAANIRAAKAAAVVEYMSSGRNGTISYYSYDAVKGRAYYEGNQMVNTHVADGYGKSSENKDKVVMVRIRNNVKGMADQVLTRWQDHI